jgi:hypothetical protein
MLLCHCESDARRLVRLVSIKDLQKEGPAAAAFAFAHGKELRPAFKPPDSLVDVLLVRHRPVFSGIPALGRETSAAT